MNFNSIHAVHRPLRFGPLDGTKSTLFAHRPFLFGPETNQIESILSPSNSVDVSEPNFSRLSADIRLINCPGPILVYGAL